MNAQLFMIAGIVVGIVLLVVLATYNGLMQLRQDVRTAWAQMDDQLKNRYQLIPILVQIVQAAGGESAERLPAVSAAKNQAAVAFNPVQLAEAESALSAGIEQVLNAAEQQEGLKTDPRFADIRCRLLTSEDAIAQSTRRYNDRVDALNASMSSFPYVFTATVIGLRLQPMFGAGDFPQKGYGVA
jgi:LemA protein